MVFNCRVCGARNYNTEIEPGTYSCSGCSAIFKDPEAFSIPSVKFKILGLNGKEPEKNKELDSGYDLFSAYEYIIPPGKTEMVKTEIAIELPLIYEAQVRARSGLAKKYGIQVANSPGTIDNGYRNQIGVLLYNSSNVDFHVEIGDRIAQLVIKHSPQVVFEEANELSETDRGLTGFGDSGIKGKINNLV
jgi:dUTP pyrophosphatase